MWGGDEGQRVPGYVLLSSLITGLVFWLCMFGEYILSKLNRGYLPLDSVVFLLPILVFSVAIGLLFFFPFFLQLVKFGKGSIIFVMPSAIVFTLFSVLIITQQYSDYMAYVSSIVSAIFGTLFFFKLLKNSDIEQSRY